MCTVKKSEILMISLHLKNEKRYRKNCYAFGIHKKQSFWSKILAKIGKFKYFVGLKVFQILLYSTRQAQTNKRDRLAKYCVFIGELTKIPFSFCFAARSFLLKGIGGVFIGLLKTKIGNIVNVYDHCAVHSHTKLTQQTPAMLLLHT